MESIEHDFYLNPVSIGLLLLAILTLWIYKRQGRAKLPPGPWHIPFIGNAWELAADPDLRKSLRRLHKQYGDIYRLYMGPKLAVVISGYEAIKEVFVKRGGEFSDRPDTLFSSLIAEKKMLVEKWLKRYTFNFWRSLEGTPKIYSYNTEEFWIWKNQPGRKDPHGSIHTFIRARQPKREAIPYSASCIN